MDRHSLFFEQTMIELETFPLILQHNWLANEVIHSIKSTPYSNTIIKKNFEPTLLKVSPILRICKFLRVTNKNDVTVILADSTHRILAYFPFIPTVVDFENKYCQRITYHTINNLIDIKRANLRFINTNDLERDYGFKESRNLSIAILEVLEFELYQRDPISFTSDVENKITFVYDDLRYEELCKSDVNLQFDDLMESAIAG
ncbi:EST3 [[Candida] subhashii]|uniref:Telomere replication protein EST3 n=1 Tax=[Candida] subhashii TaxID=561895 RepID=A0A8J5QM06_9ASCO|nr:EST3 [[Candida] subhashii]KAG7662940.1 EST3 [[Candida] subhashii]